MGQELIMFGYGYAYYFIFHLIYPSFFFIGSRLIQEMAAYAFSGIWLLVWEWLHAVCIYSLPIWECWTLWKEFSWAFCGWGSWPDSWMVGFFSLLVWHKKSISNRGSDFKCVYYGSPCHPCHCKSSISSFTSAIFVGYIYYFKMFLRSWFLSPKLMNLKIWLVPWFLIMCLFCVFW